MRQGLAAIVWVGLCVCAGWAGPAQAESAATLPLTECRLEHPLHLTSISARCGALRVPQDPEASKGESIELKVAVVPALNRRSTASPMFLLAGGPGQSAMQVYVALSSAFARINRNHAIVLLDQRGTRPPVPDLRISGVQQPVDRCRRCARRPRNASPSWGGGASTPPASRFEISTRCARPWAEQIDLYAASCSTRVAELYMRRYPARLRSFGRSDVSGTDHRRGDAAGWRECAESHRGALPAGA